VRTYCGVARERIHEEPRRPRCVRRDADLDASAEIDAGDPVALAASYTELRDRLPRLSVLGGCCGTDFRHLEAIMTAWRATP
jgi:S-methylmethionine-dependent homocysteine/selenocysteine methylase